MTNVTSLLAPVPGLGKAAWLDVMPEYHPYKYISFPVNAGNQIWSLTRALEAGWSGRTSAAGSTGCRP